MSAQEWRIVDGAGAPVDEGLDVGWVIYEKREDADEARERAEDGMPEGAPYAVQERDVEPWKAVQR
jgi:hypothetical protein